MTEPDTSPAPIGFRLIVIAAVIYLAVRAVEGVVWLVERF